MNHVLSWSISHYSGENLHERKLGVESGAGNLPHKNVNNKHKEERVETGLAHRSPFLFVLLLREITADHPPQHYFWTQPTKKMFYVPGSSLHPLTIHTGTVCCIAGKLRRYTVYLSKSSLYYGTEEAIQPINSMPAARRAIPLVQIPPLFPCSPKTFSPSHTHPGGEPPSTFPILTSLPPSHCHQFINLIAHSTFMSRWDIRNTRQVTHILNSPKPVHRLP